MQKWTYTHFCMRTCVPWPLCCGKHSMVKYGNKLDLIGFYLKEDKLKQMLTFLINNYTEANFNLRRHGYFMSNLCLQLTHWGRVTHICVNEIIIIGSDNGSSPGRRQAIIWTNAGILLTGPLWTSFSEILIELLTFSFKKMGLKVSSAKRRPFCLGLNVLMSALVWCYLSVLQVFGIWWNSRTYPPGQSHWIAYTTISLSPCRKAMAFVAAGNPVLTKPRTIRYH